MNILATNIGLGEGEGVVGTFNKNGARLEGRWQGRSWLYIYGNGIGGEALQCIVCCWEVRYTARLSHRGHAMLGTKYMHAACHVAAQSSA